MSRGNVEGQGLTDWHRVTWIVNFLCVRGVIKKTISYYLSQELWWQIPKKFFFFCHTNTCFHFPKSPETE